nr:hypothetical protein [Acidobacteriota bacterium]
MINGWSAQLAMQPAPASPDKFDFNVVWRTFTDLGESLLVRVPYIVIGLIVFLGFLLLARIIKRILLTISFDTSGQKTVKPKLHNQIAPNQLATLSGWQGKKLRRQSAQL